MLKMQALKSNLNETGCYTCDLHLKHQHSYKTLRASQFGPNMLT